MAIPLADAGIAVSGIELSRAMIARLREKADGNRIPVVQGDMAEATAGTGFSLAFLVFNTIANLLTQEEQVRCFENPARHLAPGGCFVVELWVPQLRSLPPGRADRAHPAPVHLARRAGPDGELAGFERESRWADWDRSPFTDQSRSHVTVYRLRAG